MKKDIILAGVGGQGILTMAAAIGLAAIDSGLHLKQAEVHGMSQRGGAVQSHLRISSDEIFSDLIPQGKADMIISIEPMESLRYTQMLCHNGWLIANANPHINIPDYPEMEQILNEIKKVKNHVIIDADAIAKEIDAPRATNIIVLGAAAPFMDMDISHLEKGLEFLFGKKGAAVLEMNIKALRAGRDYSEKSLIR